MAINLTTELLYTQNFDELPWQKWGDRQGSYAIIDNAETEFCEFTLAESQYRLQLRRLPSDAGTHYTLNLVDMEGRFVKMPPEIAHSGRAILTTQNEGELRGYLEAILNRIEQLHASLEAPTRSIN